MGNTQLPGVTVPERDILRQYGLEPLYAFGTAAIFERRAKIHWSQPKKLSPFWVSVFPSAIGGVVRSFSVALHYLEFALWIAGIGLFRSAYFDCMVAHQSLARSSCLRFGEYGR